MNKKDLRTYIAVTGTYWGFTLTDGALRMLVLLHFHTLGFSPLDLAILFLLYEATGIFSNFFGGWIGSRFSYFTDGRGIFAAGDCILCHWKHHDC